MFMHHGFLPIQFGYHQMIPTLSSPKGGVFDFHVANTFVETIFPLNAFLERLWLVNTLSTNIFVVGKKVEAFHG
jgi:hypothetical protein